MRNLRTRDERGFTLVELMIVIVIIGVLSMLAVVGFRKLVGSARTTEATQVVQAIRVAQESFHAETGTYADVSTTLCVKTNCSALYPQVTSAKGAIVGNFKTGWGASCTSGCNSGMDWLMLPVHTQGSVLYGYSTVAGLAGVKVGTGSAGSSTTVPLALPNGGGTTLNVGFGTAAPSADWYLITAVGDEDEDGVPCVVLGQSFTNELVVGNEGN